MLKALFTLDYEIHGNGEGCPRKLMVEPTARMLDFFDHYGAKLTLMADVAEILKFKEYQEKTGRDDYHYEAIRSQLIQAIQRGHDVQLHLHASYFNARQQAGRWQQDWTEYNFAELPPHRLHEVIRQGKGFLESLLRPVDPAYRCVAFRAANWAVSPSANVVEALVANGIRIETSVFKYGHREGFVNFDYHSAHSSLVPWRVNANNICEADNAGQLVEFPIYCESRRIGAFITPQRIYRAMLGRLHQFSDVDSIETKNHRSTMAGKSHWLTRQHAWKADFNQCTGGQLIRALERADARYGGHATPLPFVLIGHSKLFTPFNQWSLRPFLSYIADRPERFAFARFGDFDLHDLCGMEAAHAAAQQPVFDMSMNKASTPVKR